MAVRVLMLAERFPPEVTGGGELSAQLVAREVARQEGLHVTVLTQGDGAVTDDEGFQVARTVPRGAASIPDELSRGELLTARAAPVVARELRDADLVHCLSPRAIPAAVAGARLAGRPATAVVNDSWATCFTHSHVRGGSYCGSCSLRGLRECLADIDGNVTAAPVIWTRFRRRIKALRRLSAIAVISPVMGSLLRDHGVDVPVSVIPVPFDLGPWEAVPSAAPEAGLVVFVGRLAHGKGVLETLDAFASAARDISEARLLMVGDGPLMEKARARADALGLGDRVALPGWVEPGKLPAVLGRAQVVMAPFVRVEAFGRVLLEAAAAARPVVTTDLAGGAEVLGTADGGGLVVPFDDVDAWADALGELLGDPERSARMGAGARERVEDIYGTPRTGELYRALFEGALGRQA